MELMAYLRNVICGPPPVRVEAKEVESDYRGKGAERKTYVSIFFNGVNVTADASFFYQFPGQVQISHNSKNVGIYQSGCVKVLDKSYEFSVMEHIEFPMKELT
jgi:hypothetical protein